MIIILESDINLNVSSENYVQIKCKLLFKIKNILIWNNI